MTMDELMSVLEDGNNHRYYPIPVPVPEALPDGFVTNRNMSIAWNEEQIAASRRERQNAIRKNQDARGLAMEKFRDDLREALLSTYPLSPEQAGIVAARVRKYEKIRLQADALRGPAHHCRLPGTAESRPSLHETDRHRPRRERGGPRNHTAHDVPAGKPAAPSQPLVRKGICNMNQKDDFIVFDAEDDAGLASAAKATGTDPGMVKLAAVLSGARKPRTDDPWRKLLLGEE